MRVWIQNTQYNQQNTKSMTLLKSLNEFQKEAVVTTEGPVLVIAGAGSGKTKTLTHRVVYLIQEKNIHPHNILAVTFTNKASQEMKSRIAQLLSQKSENKTLPHIGTFHNTCVKILRREIERLGYKKSFNIFDDQDQLALVKKVFAQLQISKDQFNPRTVLSIISKSKNELKNSDDFEREAQGFYQEIIAKIYKTYQKELRENNALDFDDLIRLTVEIFEQFPDVLSNYQNLFKYIMVDEYQDTNHAQYKLIKLLSQKHKNIWVCGDDFQAIYGWRQADIANILNFEKDYPNTREIKLEQNYRSTQIILDAAAQVIAKNANQRDKKIWTQREGGKLITSYEADDEKDEAQFISSEIEKLIKEDKRKYSDFAVLYRTNAQSRVIEESFLKNSIPYRIIGGTKFYQRKEIKDIMAYLRLIQNPNDSVSLERVINEPKRGLGTATLAKWIYFAKENKLDYITAGLNLNETSELNSGKIKAIAEFSKLLEKMSALRKTSTLPQFIGKISSLSGYEKMLSTQGEEGEVRQENIRELLSVAQKFEKEPALDCLDSFLEEVSLASDTDKINQEKNSVHLMTLHSAKGLEFPIVFISGMEEGVLPHSRSLLSHKEMEEERRLMYVGITRAEEKVYLSFTGLRTIFGSTQCNPPSRFLEDIPEELKEPAEKKFFTSFFKKKETPKKKKLKKYSDGEKVTHPEFGDGIIISSDKENVTVVFKKVGIKKLSILHAPLESK